MKKYYLHDGVGQKGPYTIEELKQLTISKDSNIWFDGLDEWKRASEIEELQSILTVIPPVFNPPPIKSSQESHKKLTVSDKSKLNFGTAGIVMLIIIILISVFYAVNKYNGDVVKEITTQANIQAGIDSALKEKERLRLEEEKQKLELVKKNIRNNIDSYLSIQRSDYSVDRFWGGITDLYFTASNKTDYNFEKVELEVKYYRTNGGLFKTERVVFDVPARGEIRQDAPSSNKGVRAEYEIVSIYSQDLELCYNRDDYPSKNASDPYKCD